MAHNPVFHSLLQITDLHILRTKEATLVGINTEHYFHAILELAFATHAPFDLILLTGDLAQDPCQESYQRIRKGIESYKTPCVCLPGNHDDFELMQQLLNTPTIHCNKQVFLTNWQIISLNSQIAFSEAGRLEKEELEFLEQCLKDYPHHHALIAVHHHCLPTNSRWLDTMMIPNGDELFSIVAKYPQVKAISCGHIHQLMDTQLNAVRILGTPSTCFQFKPDSEKFSLDDLAPGYRTLQLYEDGRVETQIYRLSGALVGLHTNIPGY